jgi:hypothetical protein
LAQDRQALDCCVVCRYTAAPLPQTYKPEKQMKYKCKCPPNSPFHWRDNPRPSIFSQDNSVLLSIRQSTVVDKKREKGHDVSHLPGLTTKEQRIVNLRQFTVYTRAGKL